MLLNGIFWTNNRKHGYIKGTIGGYTMYPSIILFVLFQVFFLRVLRKVLVIFNVQPLERKDYVSYGRVNLSDYSWFDRVNCHFCAYANGTTHIVSATLDLIGTLDITSLNTSEKMKTNKLLKRAFFYARAVALVGICFAFVFEKLLGYKRANLNEITSNLISERFAIGLRSKDFKLIYTNTFKLRALFESFHIFISTIENNWCPLTYANKKILLDHQEKFSSTRYEDVVSYIKKIKIHEIPPK